MKDGKEIFNGLESLASEMRSRRKELKYSLSCVEKEILDIRHYIEFYTLNACQGYNASKMLKERLQKRRSIKDELESLDKIAVMGVGHIGNGKGRKDLENLQCKQYHPRVLRELFGNRDAVHFDSGSDRKEGV